MYIEEKNMVLISVNKKDRPKVFKILFRTGKFSKIGDMYRIEENEREALKQIEKEHIKYETV